MHKRQLWAVGMAAVVIHLAACAFIPKALLSGLPAWLTATAPSTTMDNLPGRATWTPAPDSLGPTAEVTSPFVLPTGVPEALPTPARDCTVVFPPDSLEAIEFGRTTLEQIEAAFGQGEYESGRATQFRFEDSGCTLRVTFSGNEAQEVEVSYYGTLGLLLDRYGPPTAVGISEGNLTLLDVGSAVLFYPEQGVIALFHTDPAALTHTSPVDSLWFRASFEVESQTKRLNVRLIAWEPPLR